MTTFKPIRDEWKYVLFCHSDCGESQFTYLECWGSNSVSKPHTISQGWLEDC